VPRPFSDVAAERAVLAGILQHGGDAFVDVDDLIDADCFTVEANRDIYRCVQDFYSERVDRKIDVQSILQAGRRLGYDFVSEPEYRKQLRALGNFRMEPDTVRGEAARLLKLSIAKQLHDETQRACEDLQGVTGDESINEILGLAENRIFDFTARVNGSGEGTVHIAQGGKEWLENILEQPAAETVGIPSPFPKYNRQIGGGFRRQGIAVVGARMKQGKSLWCDNVCLHVAGKLGIPVFNADTEMTQHEHLARILANITGIDSNRIELGRLTAAEGDSLRKAMEWLETIPYHYESVIDKSFEEQLASMRRWVIKNVGVDENGRRKDCLLVYDYLQLADPNDFHGNFKEYQLLGFQMVALQRVTARCDVACLAMVQLNREAIKTQSTGVVADSDRIGRKCHNLSILRKKGDDELAADPKEGQSALHVLVARHGPGAIPGDYINLHFDGATARMTEGRTRYEVEREKVREEKGIEVDYDATAAFDTD
jgi:replicative DNA helicase